VTAAARKPARAAPLRFELDGGALALLESSHTVPLVSIVVALRCGSAGDPADKSGLARLAMRMLRRGCEGMTAEQIDFRIDALGAEMAVDTSASTVAIHAQVIERNLDAFVELLARVLATPTFPEDQLQRLIRETQAEIIEARDSDRVLAQKAMQRTLFPAHPYGRNAGGTVESAGRVTRDDVVAFFGRHAVQGNVVVGLAGDVDATRGPVVARKLVAAFSRGEPTADAVPEPTLPPGRRLVFVDKPERTQTHMIVGTLGTSPRDDDHVPLIVSNAIFGGTFTSRLMREIRSKRGWSYGASARLSIDRRRQAWTMSTFPAAEDAAPCLKLALELMRTWVDGGVTPREVAFIGRYLVRSYAFEVDTALKRLHQALDVELLGLDPEYHSAWVQRVRGVTTEAASTAPKKRIRTDDFVAVVVGTASQVLEPVKEALGEGCETSVVPPDAE
jgi:zinc protease